MTFLNLGADVTRLKKLEKLSVNYDDLSTEVRLEIETSVKDVVVK
jgi:hypothetical protein